MQENLRLGQGRQFYDMVWKKNEPWHIMKQNDTICLDGHEDLKQNIYFMWAKGCRTILGWSYKKCRSSSNTITIMMSFGHFTQQGLSSAKVHNPFAKDPEI